MILKGSQRGGAKQLGRHLLNRADNEHVEVHVRHVKMQALRYAGEVERIMRDNWLSNRVFTAYDNIVDHCCEAWNKLIDQPWHIMTIGCRKWARGS